MTRAEFIGFKLAQQIEINYNYGWSRFVLATAVRVIKTSRSFYISRTALVVVVVDYKAQSNYLLVKYGFNEMENGR